jgi:putative NIF3 family GTP cyclohydrolase 1 type 2
MRVVDKTEFMGQGVVSVTGNLKRKVPRVILNIGAWGSKAENMIEAREATGADAAIATEFCWWREAGWALDTDFGLIHVQHGVSEMMGMQSLYEYLKVRLPDLEFEFIEESSLCRFIGRAGVIRTCYC